MGHQIDDQVSEFPRPWVPSLQPADKGSLLLHLHGQRGRVPRAGVAWPSNPILAVIATLKQAPLPLTSIPHQMRMILLLLLLLPRHNGTIHHSPGSRVWNIGTHFKKSSLVWKENGLGVLELEFLLIWIMSETEELWASSPSTSLPAQLLMSKMVLQMLQVEEFEVAGAANSLASRRPFLIPQLLCKKQRHCYNPLDEKNTASPMHISPEFADCDGRKPEKAA